MIELYLLVIDDEWETVVAGKNSDLFQDVHDSLIDVVGVVNGVALSWQQSRVSDDDMDHLGKVSWQVS